MVAVIAVVESFVFVVVAVVVVGIGTSAGYPVVVVVVLEVVIVADGLTHGAMVLGNLFLPSGFYYADSCITFALTFLVPLSLVVASILVHLFAVIITLCLVAAQLVVVMVAVVVVLQQHLS